MGGDPLRDVGHREVRDRAETGQIGYDLERSPAHHLDRVRDVALGDHDALGRAGRARRVDHGGEVARCHVGRPGVEIGPAVREQFVDPEVTISLQHADRAHRRQARLCLAQGREKPLVFDDRQVRLAVTCEVGDLLGRRGVVDRDRGGATERDRGVDEMELGDVAEHQHDSIAASHPQCL